MDLTLTARPPFSLSAVVGSHGWVMLAPFGRDESGEILTYVLRLVTGPVVELRIRAVSSADQAAAGQVRVEVDGDLDAEEQADVRRNVTWMLGLDQDFSTFYTLAREEPKLAHVEAQVRGRVLRSPTLFEDVVKTILTTNTVWGGTIRMVQALVNHFGDPLLTDRARHAFPTPEQLAASDEETLRARVRSGYRSPYVLELARAVASGTLNLEALKSADLPAAELRKRLLAIKGVGGYAAANLLMLLGRYDSIPIDSWALKMVSQEWHAGQPIGPAEVAAAFERWGEYKGLAYWFWNWSQGT